MNIVETWRLEFEAWAQAQWMSCERFQDDTAWYRDPRTQFAWKVWRAANLCQKSVTPDEAPPREGS